MFLPSMTETGHIPRLAKRQVRVGMNYWLEPCDLINAPIIPQRADFFVMVLRFLHPRTRVYNAANDVTGELTRHYNGIPGLQQST